MPRATPAARPRVAPDSSAAVDAFLATLEHPRQAEIVALRALILGVDPRIAEGIKWNVPSFRMTEYFATMHLRGKTGLGLVLHLGAKKRPAGTPLPTIDDPGGLLKWLGADRAMLVVHDGADLAAKRDGISAILRSWIEFV
jgi:hypothetical protein